MKRNRKIRVIFAPTLIAILMLLSMGCARTVEKVALRFTSSARNAFTVALEDGPPAPAAAGPKDRYLGMKGTRLRGSQTTRVGFIQLPRDLWSPFLWEVSAGLYKARFADRVAPGFFCTELDARGSDPLEFYSLCAQPTTGGLNAWVTTHNYSGGATFFPGATELDLAIEADGSNLYFFARPSNSMVFYSIVDQVLFTGQTLPLLPSIGVSGIKRDGFVGFDNFRVFSNGSAPYILTQEQQIVKTIWGAVDDQVEAGYALDGALKDYVTADPLLDSSMVALDQAIAAVKALSPGKKKRQAKEHLAAARRKLKLAMESVDAQKAGAAINYLMKTAAREIKAILALEPFSIGG